MGLQRKTGSGIYTQAWQPYQGERTMRLWWRRERGPLSIGRVEGENHVAFQSGDPVVAAELMVPGA